MLPSFHQRNTINPLAASLAVSHSLCMLCCPLLLVCLLNLDQRHILNRLMSSHGRSEENKM